MDKFTTCKRIAEITIGSKGGENTLRSESPTPDPVSQEKELRIWRPFHTTKAEIMGVEPRAGFDPATSRLRGGCSWLTCSGIYQLSYRGAPHRRKSRLSLRSSPMVRCLDFPTVPQGLCVFATL